MQKFFKHVFRVNFLFFQVIGPNWPWFNRDPEPWQKPKPTTSKQKRKKKH